MKRAEPEIIASLFLKLHITGNNIHDVASRSDFLYYFLRIIHENLLFLLVLFRQAPAYTLKDFGTNSSLNRSMAYTSVIPAM